MCRHHTLTAPNSNSRGRGNKKFSVFIQPFEVIVKKKNIVLNKSRDKRPLKKRGDTEKPNE